jgi:hypothetical protein
MNEIEFSYEITEADYTESNALLSRKLKVKKYWIVPLLGVAVIAIPFLHLDSDGYMAPNLSSSWPLIVSGLLLIFYGVRSLSPAYIARQHYPRSGLSRRQFTAHISAKGFLVQGTYIEWKYSWQAVLLAEESETLFALYTGLQLFVFAKRHLNDEQLKALRQLIAAQPAFPGGTTPKY